ncbi:MAG TPA: GNAT family N-acetyltransferase [Gemmatimonadales bacterium]|nr:GNAT family N-acetyltransferase [Gemmatimonadales bacterium]
MQVWPRMQQRLLLQTQDVFNLLVRGHPGTILQRALGTRLRSETLALGLRRDLVVPHTAPAPKIPLIVRPLAPGDDLSILDIEQPDLSSDAMFERLAQRRLVAAELPTCWVAIAPDGKVCYMQWLVAPKHNDRMRGQWGDLFPMLGPGEALLEGAYTGDAYRGQGIMAYAMSRIAEAASEFGARWVQTFVGVTNVASLKGCKKAGFVPFVRRSEVWWLMRRTVEFAGLPQGTPYPFEQ